VKIEALDLSDARAEMARQARLREEQIETPVLKTKQAIGPMLFQVGDGEDAGFQRITSPQMRRDLNPLMQMRMQSLAYYLSATNPFAKRIKEVITSYVVGRGFNPTAKDAGVQQVIDKFWKDPVNRMRRTVREYCNELTVYGELCIPVSVNEVDGSVRLGYVDPMDIESIEFGVLQTTGEERPEGQFGAPNSRDAGLSFPVAVIMRKRYDQQSTTRMEVIRRDEDPNSPTFGLLKGDCFYWAINKAKGASRGLSEFFCLCDWLDVFDQMIFDFADRARTLNSYVWDFTLEGADQPTIDKFRDDVTKKPPRQGGVLVHNSQVKVSAVTPDLKGADMRETARVVKGYGLGGAGLPPTFFGDSENSNKSTAEEMTGPTGKKFEDRQEDLSGNVIEILEFVVDQAIIHGVLADSVDRTVDVQCPEVQMRDLAKAGVTMGAVTNSLTIAEENGWIKSETAAQSFHSILETIGVEVQDSKTEFAEAQDEKNEREAQNINKLNPQKNLADALLALNDPEAAAKAAAANGKAAVN
jgi:hypothetical protein